ELRPCNRIAHPQIQPEVIFVKAIESAPFAPPPELEVEGMEDYFAVGLEGLESLAPIHLVHREGSCCSSFTSQSCGKVHSATGPHPIGNASVHIAALHPIKTVDQAVWVLTVSDVIAIGMWLKEGRYYTEKVVGVGGEGIPENRRGYFRVNRGCSLNGLVEGGGDSVRIISGDPLCGMSSFGFLGFKHNVVCAIPEKDEGQEFLPFLKLTRKGYTASKAYFFRKRKAGFTTSQHGEERAFVDGTIYDAVMPLKIEVMPLIKHLLSEDMEKGGALGLLEVAPEDFALPAFVCPSKIDMIQIVKQGLKRYAEQYT
ncbi:MAG: NADH:ubiquinone reductase (Na(+)-transporting) subunit A, partial [Chlamydiia bacterium]|nr:NADH:ubiquinone reductase (Na(+)-transporting) subunit A [Chlamydiia bacterium]